MMVELLWLKSWKYLVFILLQNKLINELKDTQKPRTKKRCQVFNPQRALPPEPNFRLTSNKDVHFFPLYRGLSLEIGQYGPRRDPGRPSFCQGSIETILARSISGSIWKSMKVQEDPMVHIIVKVITKP